MKTKRYLASILAISLLAAMSGCGGSTTDTNDTTAPVTDTTAEVVSDTDANGFLLDELPADLDFGGAEVNILIRTDVKDTEFYVEEATGDVVDDAIYGRNQAVQERLNVKLNFIDMAGDAHSKHIIMGALRQSVLAADGAYDIAALISNQLPELAVEGLFADMMSLPYLDFDKPWWANALTEELSIGGKLYMASGDASLGVIRDMMCIFFNKEMAEQYKLPDLYELVFDGKWTYDVLMNSIKGVYADLNGDTVRDENDQYGYAFGDPNQSYGYIEAFDLDIVERDSDGFPSKLVFGSEKVIDAHTMLTEMVQNNPDFGVDNWNKRPYMDNFTMGKVLFLNGQFKDTSTYRGVDNFDYGVLPMPKFDEEQKDYGTCVRATYSSFVIPKTANDRDMSAAVLECFASESYRQVSPAYYESALKVKYSRDDESAQVYDIIKGSVKFSFGVAFGYAFKDPQNTFKDTLWGNGSFEVGNWATQYASWEPAASEGLKKTVDTLRGME